MGQSVNIAALKDAQIMWLKVECASGMGQRSNAIFAALKDAQILRFKEECVEGMGQRIAEGRACRIDGCNSSSKKKTSKKPCVRVALVHESK